MNYAELGDRVKSKYPEYKDVDSTLLGQKTAAKYPEYKAMITAQPKAVEQLPVNSPSLMQEFIKANSQVTNAIRQPMIGTNGGAPRSFVDKYTQGVAGAIDNSPLRNHPNLGAIAYGAAGIPAGIAGMAADTITNPLETAGGIVGGRLMQAATPMALNAETAFKNFMSGVKTPKNIFELGGSNKLRQLASVSKRNLDNVFRGFNKEYDTIFASKDALEKIPVKRIESIQNKALGVLDRVPEKTPAANLIEKIVGQSDSITPRELHSLKQDLFKRAKNLTADQKSALMEVYDEVTKVLGSDDVYGAAYKNLSSRYKKFMNEEANYVSDRIYDKFDKPSEEFIKKNDFSKNEMDAFMKLEARKGSKPTIGRIKAVNRTQKLKKIGIGASATGGFGYAAKKISELL